jgi:hypothetical protein
MVEAAIRISATAFGTHPVVPDRRDSAMTKFDKMMMAVTFAEMGEADTARAVYSSLVSRLDAGGSRSWGRIAKTAGLGLFSLGLYVALFTNQRLIVEITSQGRYSLVLVLALAFAFSVVHGAFTGRFWDILGLKAKK